MPAPRDPTYGSFRWWRRWFGDRPGQLRYLAARKPRQIVLFRELVQCGSVHGGLRCGPGHWRWYTRNLNNFVPHRKESPRA